MFYSWVERFLHLTSMLQCPTAIVTALQGLLSFLCSHRVASEAAAGARCSATAAAAETTPAAAPPAAERSEEQRWPTDVFITVDHSVTLKTSQT